MKTRFLTLLVPAMLLLASCGGGDQNFIGTWKTVQTSDSAHAYEGFTLGINGIASSVKDPLNQYNHWKSGNGIILLSGKRFSDTSVVPFTDTLEIEKFSGDTLVVSSGGRTRIYVRE